nr:hypothetical protein [Brachybacterium massiliense]
MPERMVVRSRGRQDGAGSSAAVVAAVVGSRRRSRSLTGPDVVAVGVDVFGGGDDDDAVCAADVSPAGGEGAEAVAEGAPFGLAVDVVAACGVVAAGALEGCGVFGEGVGEDVGHAGGGVVDVDDDAAGAADVEEDAGVVVGHPVVGDDLGVAGGLGLPLLAEDGAGVLGALADGADVPAVFGVGEGCGHGVEAGDVGDLEVLGCWLGVGHGHVVSR